MNAADAVRAAASALADVWIEPPVLQPAALYLELAGEDIRARAFMVAGDDDQALCLRPDMTVPAVRAALAMDRWVNAFGVAYDGPVFRRQAHAAKETEFRQIGAEYFARRDRVARREAEIVRLALDACAQSGVTPHLRLGDVGLYRAIVEACGLAESWARRFRSAFARPTGLASLLASAAAPPTTTDNALAEAVAAAPSERAGAVVSELLADARIPVFGARTVDDIAARLRRKGVAARAPHPSPDALALITAAVAIEGEPSDAFMTLRGLLSHPGVHTRAPFESALDRAEARWTEIAAATPTTFSPGFGRGLAYYDGFVFELEAPALGVRASLGGGGRYDGLLADITAAGEGGAWDVGNWGAAGFALRPARIAAAAA